MLDNRVNLWQPGELTRCGFPWHGLVRRTGIEAGDPWLLELPNGKTMEVSGPGHYLRHSIGESFAYRDPRAHDIELSPAEAEAAVAAGAEWRATALLPNQVYAAPLAYFDGSETWRLTVTQTSLSFRRVRVIGGDPGEIEAVFSHPVVSLNSPPPYPENYPGSARPGSTSAYHVLDASRTGNKLLCARTWHGELQDSGSPNGFLRQIVEIWELSIQGVPDGELSAERSLLWSIHEFIENETWSDNYPNGLPYRRVKAFCYWTLAAAHAEGADLTSELYWEIDDDYDAVGDATYFDYLAPYTRLRTRTLNGRVVGAYYASDGSIKYQTVDLTVVVENQVVSVSGPTLDTDEPGSGEVPKAPGSDPSSTYWWGQARYKPGGAPNYRFSVSMTEQLSSSIEMVLRDDGAEISRFFASQSGTHARVSELVVSDVAGGRQARDFDLGSEGFDPAASAGSVRGSDSSIADSISYSSSFLLDGTLMHTDHYSASSSAGIWHGYDGLLSAWPMQPSSLWPTYTTPTSSVWVRAASYNVLMPALMGAAPSPASPGTTTRWVGAIAYRGNKLPGMLIHQGSGINLYAACNAVTGETIRDTPTPCFYL